MKDSKLKDKQVNDIKIKSKGISKTNKVNTKKNLRISRTMTSKRKGQNQE
jgi:hypothetical protein